MHSHAAPRIDRLTTLYQAAEDRLQLVGQLPAGHPVLLWLTQRLCLQLVPCLLKRLNVSDVTGVRRGPRTATALYEDELNGFAQQVAVQELVPQPSVAMQEGSPAHLVASITVVQRGGGVGLVFTDGTQPPLASIEFTAQQLRQWLAIVCKQWQAAQWPMHIWPDWMHGALAAQPPQANAVVH